MNDVYELLFGLSYLCWTDEHHLLSFLYVTICSAFIHTLEMLFNVLFALLIVELLSMYAFLLHCAIIRISYLVPY